MNAFGFARTLAPLLGLAMLVPAPPAESRGVMVIRVPHAVPRPHVRAVHPKVIRVIVPRPVVVAPALVPYYPPPEYIESATSDPVFYTDPLLSATRPPPPRPAKSAPPASGRDAPAAELKRAALAKLYDVDAVPGIDERGRAGYKTWLAKKMPRAFVVAGDGAWYSTWGVPENDPGSPLDPTERAMYRCARAGKPDCRIYAIDHAVVWKVEQAGAAPLASE